MPKTKFMTLAACATGLVTAPLTAEDQKSLSGTVREVKLTGLIPGPALGLKNMAAEKTVAARKLTVTGNDPEFTVEGLVACDEGATLTGVQAVAGTVINNQGSVFITQVWGHSPVLTDMAGQWGAQVSIPLKLKVTRTYNGEAIDLSFNPARRFEHKLAMFVDGGGSATQYLHQDEAFDMNVPINLIAWCKMADNAGGYWAGKTAGGFVRRDVAATILFHGDPAIVDGVGVISANAGSGGTVAAPKEPEKPKRAPADADKPARRHH